MTLPPTPPSTSPFSAVAFPLTLSQEPTLYCCNIQISCSQWMRLYHRHFWSALRMNSAALAWFTKGWKLWRSIGTSLYAWSLLQTICISGCGKFWWLELGGLLWSVLDSDNLERFAEWSLFSWNLVPFMVCSFCPWPDKVHQNCRKQLEASALCRGKKELSWLPPTLKWDCSDHLHLN